MNPHKHTKGPWKYGLGYRIRPDRGTDSNGREISGPTIAEINADADRCCPPPDEIEANGLLISAAPDLLIACEAAMDILSNGLNVCSGSIVQAQIFNAIEKATKK